MNLHIIHKDKFFLPAKNAFDNYYKNQNTYLCLTLSDEDNNNNTLVRDVIYIRPNTIKGLSFFLKVIDLDIIENIFIHSADNDKINIAVYLHKRKSSIKIYWILFGNDLYYRLIKDKNYKAFDYDLDIVKSPLYKDFKGLQNYFKNIIIKLYYLRTFGDVRFSEFCELVDYLAFWNEKDFDLFKSNYKSTAVFKRFLYFELLPSINNVNSNVTKTSILVNHNASIYGNHITILDKLKQLNVKDNIICPLSYGNTNIKEKVIEYGIVNFNENFFPIVEFKPKDEYFDMLNSVKVAIFGNRRQEAGANIFAMFLMGAKVFLRKDNNMLSWLKDRGFICFSFDSNLNNLSDLLPLDEESVQINKELYQKYFNKNIEEEYFQNLIK